MAPAPTPGSTAGSSTPSGPRLTPAARRGYGLGSVATGSFGTVPGLLLLPYLTDRLRVTAGAGSPGRRGWPPGPSSGPRPGTPSSPRSPPASATAPPTPPDAAGRS